MIEGAGFTGEVDVLSIGIDGDDYGIWDALSCMRPRVVVIETHIEFGAQRIVMPYDENFAWRRGMPRVP